MSTSDPTPDHFAPAFSFGLSDTDFDTYEFRCPECSERVCELSDHTANCPVRLPDDRFRRD